ncbi:L,D-transpeptidase-like protein [Tibeticola sediminis]|uniref:L,D-transpeptidase-like protein n=1 Tax=Tibeticola sediminis TaxID=1917811 RepID=A0A3N4UPT7_9BURK|nr:L,D-transpeptidase family protein [Tibeticola sediminis]RPE72666.1 L,D-transpeptidase-like protein [Tibeticola sediminis]
MKWSLIAISLIATLTFVTQASARSERAAARAHASAPSAASPRAPSKTEARPSGDAEARLMAVYRLIGRAETRAALEAAQQLVNDYPDFQLAQLVYGDLLSSRVRPVSRFGDVPDTAERAAPEALSDLREESRQRLRALRERPPPGKIPSNFVALSPRTRHAIAIDTSRSRLYLFENTAEQGLRLVADYYISVGKLGVDKQAEGDQRTPLGVYYITSNLDPRSLKDFYGSGALPINYPNPIDQLRGRSGNGIWLHGTPPGQYARAPQASDGCIVLANTDLNHIIRTVEVRSTPVVIARQLHWASPQALRAEIKGFEDTLRAWRTAKSSGDVQRVLAFYAPEFRTYKRTLPEWMPALAQEVAATRGREIELKDLSVLRWTDSDDIMVTTFGEVVAGARTGPVKRQYWVRRGTHWKIIFEGVIG